MNKLCILTALLLPLLLTSCGSCSNTQETPTRGEATILVDESIFPMIEGQVDVFEHQYRYAKIHLRSCPGQEIQQFLIRDSARIAILPRDLTDREQTHFDSLKIIPRGTDIAYDAIALIVNRQYKDTTISSPLLKNLLAQGDGYHTLVFDHSRSGILQYIKDFAGITAFNSHIYSLDSQEALLRYIAAHENAIGFIGVDRLYEHDTSLQVYIDQIRVLAVDHSKPTQNDIAAGIYPFIRKIQIINAQGTSGLGMGFASFLAGDQGQRIVLKAGLVPVTYPKREILIRKTIEP